MQLLLIKKYLKTFILHLLCVPKVSCTKKIKTGYPGPLGEQGSTSILFSATVHSNKKKKKNALIIFWTIRK